ncbi:hypothetical protein HAP47_0020660 [Bradyrhizobium sp. 41S5]|uniref:hypothetical protein n=1 Tax=Bradyrhizobium sp. 41S5 TaxID=1404443 RepID=UPI00156ACEB9|nr:hypothetical protein [Bradyrhizobium sp. 41S5]UFX41726.1 hypothetical protein HAP47_0020660 [Bradyrhizobium sp. 41S5]
MTKADCVFTTPPTSTSAILEDGTGAHGAAELSTRPLIPASRAGACQPVGNQREPSAALPIQSFGAAISRRFFVRSLASLPVAAATPAAASLMQVTDESHAADTQLLALADEYVVAEWHYLDLLIAVDQMSEHREAPPEVLKIRPRDLELGRKPEQNAEFWASPCDIMQWRPARLAEWRMEKKETDDRLELVQWKIEPSEELCERGAEIVAAFDEWNSRKPRGYTKAKRKMKRALRVAEQLEEQILNTPAKTLEGLKAKIRCAEAWSGGKINSIDGCAADMILSIIEDIEDMGAVGAS